MEQIQYDVRPGEFADAMKTTQSARLLFWLVAGLMVIFQLAVFGLVDAGGVLEGERRAAAADRPATQPAEMPAEPPPAASAGQAPAPRTEAPAKAAPAGKGPAAPSKSPAAEAKAPSAAEAKTLSAATSSSPEAARAKAPTTPRKRPLPPSKTEKWEIALRWSLPAAKFVAMVAAMLLSLTIFLAVGLSLVGRLGGMAGLISSFFWSLIFLAMVMPWQHVLAESTLACGALYGLGELLAGRARWAHSEAASADAALYYGRFVAYPVLALLVWLMVHAKFARACSRMQFPHALPAPSAAPPPERVAPTEPEKSAASAGAFGPRPPAGKSLAQRTLDEKSQAGTGRKIVSDGRSMGPLTERILRVQSSEKTEKGEKDSKQTPGQ